MWDPLPQLLDSAEPAARWIAHAVLLDKPAQDPDVAQAHTDVLAGPATEDLLARLPDWEVENAISGHDKPQFAPHLLNLLADMGVTAADDHRIAAVLDALLCHQSTDGRFQSLQRWRKTDGALSASLPCDHHAITEVLVRAGRADHPAVRRGLHRMLADLAETPPGPAWTCVPDPQVGFRGPGRKGDICPQVTLQALRAFSGVPDLATSPEVVAAARTSLAVWRARASSKPYMFGHGRAFSRGKWPSTWYSALAVVDTIGRYPAAWSGPDATDDDRDAMAEITASLVAYTVSADGTVIPRSAYRGFASHSFGQKKHPSDFAAAVTAVALYRVRPLWPLIDAHPSGVAS